MDCSPHLMATPSRSEADVRAQRQVITERAELYERMLAYDERRAAFVAQQSWECRWGHYFNHMNHAPTWAPLPHMAPLIASATLYPDVAAETWNSLGDELCDWTCIIADLVDSAETPHQRERAECEVQSLKARIKRARDFARLLRAEHARRASGGRVA